MVTIELEGRITENGKLEAELPADVQPNKVKSVKVTIEVEKSPDEFSWEERPWTSEEIEQLMKRSEPKTGAEIAAMIESGALKTTTWAEMEIDDVVE